MLIVKNNSQLKNFLGSVNKIVIRDKFGEEYTGTTDRYSEDEPIRNEFVSLMQFCDCVGDFLFVKNFQMIHC